MRSVRMYYVKAVHIHSRYLLKLFLKVELKIFSLIFIIVYVSVFRLRERLLYVNNQTQSVILMDARSNNSR